MKSWLKFFGLSFFSDKIAKEARIRGVLNCVLGFLLALVFIFCGVLASNSIPFYTHYKNASDFKAFINNSITLSHLTVNGGRVSSKKVVNTLLNETDAENYGVNGYSLVIDTRPSTAPDDFEAYCLSKDGEREISYEEYLNLTESEKGGYDFKIRYTPNELVLTSSLVAEYEEFLSAVEDGDISKQYSELLNSKGTASADEYNRSVYALYVKAYYPDISAYERAGDVPLLRSYYYRTYLNSNDIEKSLFIFDDVMFGFFDTDGGISVTFYGYYVKVSDGEISADSADRFIKSVFGSSSSVSANVYLMNVVKFIPLIVAIPLVLALIAKIALMVLKDEKYKKYSVCFKIECSYLAVASLLTALVLFICGFFISSNVLNSLPLAIFAIIMTVRTAVYLIYEKLTLQKAQAEMEKQPQED